jgi:hypothetical protein
LRNTDSAQETIASRNSTRNARCTERIKNFMVEEAGLGWTVGSEV